jgi:hypothetical protein
MISWMSQITPTHEREQLTVIPHSSPILNKRNLAIQRWSPISIPSQGPTWNSHWAGMTSALIPEILIPA